jgi:broad specificity phosphatase PhoE
MAAQEVEVVESNEAAFRGKTVFIVRHAQGQHNVSPRFQFDPPLTDAGLKQVRRQKKVSSTLGVDLVLVSPLRRTLQTASGVSATIDPSAPVPRRRTMQCLSRA